MSDVDLIHQTQTKRIVDPHGQILEETLANGHTLKSRYDELGRRIQLILPDKTINYTHSETNLSSVNVDGKTHSYAYDQANNLIKEQHIDGSTTKYTYDADSRLIHRIHHLLEETLQYDQRDNLVKLTRNGEEFSYSYDSFDHLTEEPDHSYQYDPLHNRTQKDDEMIAYNILNQEIDLAYDSNGNLLNKGSYSLRYDSLDRLIKVKTWFTTTTYTYDSEHRRVLENSTPILWDGQHEIGEPNFFRVLGRTPFAEIGAGVAIYDRGRLLQPLHTVTGDVFQIIDQYPIQHFTAFGEGTADIRWGYQSKVHDQSGLIYFGRRYYDPDSGRFITPDPTGYTDSLNLYAYTLNSPLTHCDPYGLLTLDVQRAYYNPQYPSWDDLYQTFANSTIHTPQFQGLMQAAGGLAEASMGGAISLTSAGIGIPAGFLMVGHGLDHFFTGIQTAFSGSHQITLTNQLLQTSGLSPSSATWADDSFAILATLGTAATLHLGTRDLTKLLASPKAPSISRRIFQQQSAGNITKTTITPTNYFGSKTYTEMEEILFRKFGTPKPGAPGGKSFYNPQSKRTFHVHYHPEHNLGKPHVDIRKRGSRGTQKYNLKDGR